MLCIKMCKERHTLRFVTMLCVKCTTPGRAHQSQCVNNCVENVLDHATPGRAKTITIMTKHRVANYTQAQAYEQEHTKTHTKTRTYKHAHTTPQVHHLLVGECRTLWLGICAMPFVSTENTAPHQDAGYSNVWCTRVPVSFLAEYSDVWYKHVPVGFLAGYSNVWYKHVFAGLGRTFLMLLSSKKLLNASRMGRSAFNCTCEVHRRGCDCCTFEVSKHM